MNQLFAEKQRALVTNKSVVIRYQHLKAVFTKLKLSLLTLGHPSFCAIDIFAENEDFLYKFCILDYKLALLLNIANATVVY
ncbi:hypothetical protein L596_020902 [Steinernema carpocapsae]|uniref:Uncharacterized protein n=1 Tax=Steinernema carpocapsae TaxID=34508 RepID=A0A4U5MUX0_STECR|nr:hypothetical protein L596_020902 [Steinernema carpocapsae]